MSACLAPYFYFDNDIFQMEQEALFNNVWQLFGFTSEVGSDNDYVCRDVGGSSVVVQNFQGALKGFLNVCSHRFSFIREVETGSGPLRCPYHGWTYDKEGIPTGIPFASQFEGLTGARRTELCLESWLVETCGQFVFVKRKDDGVSLDSFLGGTRQWLAKVSAAMGEKLDLNRYTIDSNWKVAVENALEAYHVSMVHPTSFSRIGTSGNQFEFTGPHSSWTSEVDQELFRKWQKAQRFYASRPFQIDGYLQQMIFPNVTIVTMFGTTFSVQHFRPISPGETECSSHVFAAKLTEPMESSAARSVVAIMNKSSVEFNREVFDEDRRVCEVVQKGIEQNRDHRGLLGAEEERVSKFQEAYQAIITGETK